MNCSSEISNDDTCLKCTKYISLRDNDYCIVCLMCTHCNELLESPYDDCVKCHMQQKNNNCIIL